MPAPRRGSRAAPEGPGRAGSDRQCPPSPTRLPPGRSNSERGPAAAPASRLRRPGTRLETPFAPTRAGVAPQPQPYRPRGLRARCQSHHSPRSHTPRNPWGRHSPPPAPAQARRLRCVRGSCSPSSGHRRGKRPMRLSLPGRGSLAPLLPSWHHLLGRQSRRRQLQVHHAELGTVL